MRMPFKRTGTVTSPLPSSNNRACSGAPIRCRASPRASTRPAHRAHRDAQQSVERPADRPGRCAPASNSGGPCHPSCDSCGTDTCAKSNLLASRGKYPRSPLHPKRLLAPAILLIRLDPPQAKLLKPASNCASWASDRSSETGIAFADDLAKRSSIAFRSRQTASRHILRLSRAHSAPMSITRSL